MKLLLVIDHFGSGGAQRQIVELACGLKRRGHDVEMFIYFPEYDFFRRQLEAAQIVIHEFRKGPGFSLGVVRSLASLMRTGGFDVVVSYLSGANVYAQLARAWSGGPALIVSERTSHLDDRSWISALLRRAMHVSCDAVVANSESQGEWLRGKWWLRHKVSCIYNGLDLRTHDWTSLIPAAPHDLRLLAIGRVGPEKNVANVIRALASFHEKHGYVPQMDWVGPRDNSRAGQAYCRRVDELLERYPAVRSRWSWLGVRADVPALLSEHHALIHASLYEGLPNVVCEALARGMPVLASDVCDHSRLVAEGQRGFLFDPGEPRSMADAIEKLTRLTAAEWLSFGRNARRYAEEHLDVEKMLDAYERLFARLPTRLAG